MNRKLEKFWSSFWKTLKKSSEMRIINKFWKKSEKFSIYRYFFLKLEDNFVEILKKFLGRFKIIISQKLLKIFSKISGRYRTFLKELGEIIGYIWINSKKILKNLWENIGLTTTKYSETWVKFLRNFGK